jgi:hypothetical protein
VTEQDRSTPAHSLRWAGRAAEGLLRARRVAALLTVLYTTTAAALVGWARAVALPTRGGISASEVLDGVVPGGLTALLVVWVLLVCLTAAVWAEHLRRAALTGHTVGTGRRAPLRALGRDAAVWLAWTSASALGVLLGARFVFGLLEAFTVPVPRGPWTASLDVAALGALAGAVLGACQAVVLMIGRGLGRREAVAWAAATAAGAGVALGLARGGDGLLRLVGLGALFDAVGGEVWQVLAFALLGGAIGCGQWLLLRRRVARALWWVPACVAATLATALVLSPRTGVPWWLTLALFGGVTGAVLVLLPRAVGPEGDPPGGARLPSHRSPPSAAHEQPLRMLVLPTAVALWLVGAPPAAAAPVPVAVCAEDRAWRRPSPAEMARTVWRDNRYGDAATGVPQSHAPAYYTRHFLFFTFSTASGASHALDMTGLRTSPRDGWPTAALCMPAHDPATGRAREVVVWALGYRVLGADVAGGTLTLTVEPNSPGLDRGYAIVKLPRPDGAWSARFVLPDGREVARAPEPDRILCCAEEPDPEPRAVLARFVDARLERRGAEVLDLMTDDARAAVVGQHGSVHQLLPVSNPCWHRYEVVAFGWPSAASAAARVRIYEHQWMGDVGGRPPQSWEQEVELVRRPVGWRVSRLGPAGAARDEPGEPHGPIISACKVGRRAAAWLPAALPATGGPSAPIVPTVGVLGLVLVGVGAKLRAAATRGPGGGDGVVTLR